MGAGSLEPPLRLSRRKNQKNAKLSTGVGQPSSPHRDLSIAAIKKISSCFRRPTSLYLPKMEIFVTSQLPNMTAASALGHSDRRRTRTRSSRAPSPRAARAYARAATLPPQARRRRATAPTQARESEATACSIWRVTGEAGGRTRRVRSRGRSRAAASACACEAGGSRAWASTAAPARAACAASAEDCLEKADRWSRGSRAAS